MVELAYQRLTQAQCLEVLRSTHVTRAAFCDGERPYLVPMAFQLDAEGVTPVILLAMPDKGRKADCLRRCSRVCLEFESPGCASVDVVLLEGAAEPVCVSGGLIAAVRAADMSGRRFFLTEE